MKSGESDEKSAHSTIGIIPTVLISIGGLLGRIGTRMVCTLWRSLALLLPGILVIAAPLLIIIIVITAVGSGQASSADYYYTYLASTTDATTDAVIAKDAQFVWPVKGRYYVTSIFGPRWGTFHYGIDLDASLGTPILAGASGTVCSAGYESSMGNYVILDHGVKNSNSIKTVYMHNSRLAVKTGDTVTAGQIIAYAGETGDADGVHCHFEVHVNGVKVNPAQYLGLPAGIGAGDVTGLIMGK